MGGYFANAGIFLTETLFGLYIIAVLLRFLFQVFRADFYNPVSQFIVKVTNPPLKPLRRIIPGIRGIDFSAIVLIFALKIVEILLVGLMKGVFVAPLGLLLLTLTSLVSLVINVFTFAIIVQVVISWVSPGLHNPITSLLHSITEPLLAPARRLIKPIHGFDLSPLLVLIALQLMQLLVVLPLTDLSRAHLAAIGIVSGLPLA